MLNPQIILRLAVWSRAQFGTGEALVERRKRGLRGGDGPVEGNRQPSGDRPDIDHPSPRPLELRQQGLGEGEGADDIDFELAPQLRRRKGELRQTRIGSRWIRFDRRSNAAGRKSRDARAAPIAHHDANIVVPA